MSETYMIVVRPVWGNDKILKQGSKEYIEAEFQKCLDGYYVDVPKQASFYLCKIEKEEYHDGRVV